MALFICPGPHSWPTVLIHSYFFKKVFKKINGKLIHRTKEVQRHFKLAVAISVNLLTLWLLYQ